MKRTVLVLLIPMLVAALGCLPGLPPPQPQTPTATVLARGGQTAAVNRATLLAEVTVAQPGTLVADIRWAGAPSTMTAFFKHGSPENHGWVQGASPIISTVNVTAGGRTKWKLYVANSGAVARAVKYVVKFTPR